MLVASLIFMAVLLVVGCWCILLVRDGFKKNAAAIAESEAALRPRPRYEMTPQQALMRARAAARREAERQRAERWKNLTPSLVMQAFRNFYEDEQKSSYDASHVSAAFEKFTKEMRVKD